MITGIVVTNDGNAILRELDIAHPAAKACPRPIFAILLNFCGKIKLTIPMRFVKC